MIDKDYAAADCSRLGTLFEFLGQHTERALFLGEACPQGGGRTADVHILAGNDPFLQMAGDQSIASLQQPPIHDGSHPQAFFNRPDGQQLVFDVVYFSDNQLIAALAAPDDGVLLSGPAAGIIVPDHAPARLIAGQRTADAAAAAGRDAHASIVLDPREAIARLHRLGRTLAELQDPERIARAFMQTACAITGARSASLNLYDVAGGGEGEGLRLDEQPPGACPAESARHQALAGLIQATPLCSSSGQVMGVLETWLPGPDSFGALEQQTLELAARQAADRLERLESEQALEQSRQNLDSLVERMRRVDQNRNKFLNILSHELRNPLASIMMSLSLLDHAVPGGIQAMKARDILKRQTAHLSNLVDDLLDVTRITNNKVKLKLAPLELNDIAARVADDYRAQYVQRGINLEVRLNPEPVHICADATRVIQAIGNLLQNAMKFTDAGGTTWLSTETDPEADGAWAVIRVRDTGIGIRPESLGDLFQPFSQLEIGNDANRVGLGLGLAIVKGMVELHGGTISVFSEGENQGTEFTIRLPVMEAQPCTIAVDPAQSVLGQRSLRILVIDDSRDLADTICSLLEILGHVTAPAYNGPDGIAFAAIFKPDIILCDIGLPEIDGYEVARRIRRTPELEHIFLIALSGFAQQEDIERAVAAGFDQHVAKPVNIDVIQDILQVDIEKSRHH